MMIETDRVASLIPKGHKNAITLNQVVSLFENQGWLDGKDKERTARRILEVTGYDYTICNLQDGKDISDQLKKI